MKKLITKNNCNICNSSSTFRYLDKNIFKSISSDGNNIFPNREIYKCNNCNYYFKVSDIKYNKNLSKIYKNYKIERKFKTETNFLINNRILTRSDTIINFLFKKKILNKKKKLKILDYGIGNGDLLFKLSQKTKHILHGYDLNINNSLKRQKKFNIIEKEKTLKRNKYDIIFLIHVVEHIIDFQSFHETLKKISNKNTIYFIQTPNINNYYIDFLIYDHFSHFNQESFHRLFSKFDFGNISYFNLVNKELTALISYKKSKLKNYKNIPKEKNLLNANSHLLSLFKKISKLKRYDFLGAGNKIKLIKANIGIKNLRNIIDEDINKQNKKIFRKKILSKNQNNKNDIIPILIIDNKKNYNRLKKKYYNRKTIHHNCVI